MEESRCYEPEGVLLDIGEHYQTKGLPDWKITMFEYSSGDVVYLGQALYITLLGICALENWKTLDRIDVWAK